MRDLTSARSVRTAQALWLLVAVAATAAYAAPVAIQWVLLQTNCHPASACALFQLDTTSGRILSQHGISMGAYAVFTVAIWAAVWLIWYGLAALIIWRKPQDRGALLSAFFLVVFPLWGATAWIPSGPLMGSLTPAFIAVLLLFGLLFPDGRFVPRWTRWLAAAIVVLFALTIVPLPAPAAVVATVIFLSTFVCVVGIQIYRFRSMSSWTQRQQTKWAFFGLAAAILGLGALWLVQGLAPFPSGNGSLFGAFTNFTGTAAVVSAIPISIAIAVLRNRLWDIDRIVSRALVYTMLSVTLVALYLSSVIGLQALFQLVAGNSSSLAIALSTLAVAALFGPLRRRIQRGIDRRFYRSKYDAQLTLAAFGERVRDEVDLTQLSHDLTAVVHNTLHPEHVSLWLREGGHEVRKFTS
jgi:hypothetical protein